MSQQSSEQNQGSPGGIIRVLRLIAQLLGAAMIAFGVFADMLTGGGSPGLGIKQWALVALGALLFAAGRADRTSVSRVRAWARDKANAMSLREIVLFAITIGLTTALVQLAIIAIQRFLLNDFVRVGPHAVWMLPIGNSLILATIGVLLWLGGRLWGKLATGSSVGFVLLLVAASTVLDTVRASGAITPEAKLLLVVGIAWTIGRAAANRWAGSGMRLVPRLAVYVLVVAALGTAAALQPWWKERRALAALPDAPDGRVNLILIILDTVRAASLSVYGYERPTTPELQRFASRGVVFDNAISPSSWTLPSHGTMFTGRHPAELEVDWLTPMDATYPTLAEELSDAGYATAAFSANVGYVSVESGLARGFARFEDFVPAFGEMVRTSVMLSRVLRPFGLEEIVEDDDRGRRTAEDINGAFLGWLERKSGDRPFFAFLNYFDAHAPYYAPPPFDTLYGGARPLKPWGPNLTQEEADAWRDAYDRSLVRLDAQLGVLFRELEQRGILENTVIVVSSDHGEHFGEHSYMGHATTLYRPVVEVPLIVRGPGVPSGLRVSQRVGLRDIAASLLDFAAVDAEGRIPGRPLATVWRGERDPEPVYSALGKGIRIPKHYPNAAHALWSVYEDDLHYIASTSGDEELFRLSVDPNEMRNLLSVDTARVEVAALRQRLRAHLDSTGQSDAMVGELAARP